MKHTPGPWTIHPKVEGLGYGIHSAEGGYVYVATVHQPQQEANARLIAMAPEMLEELKSFLSLLKSYERQSYPNSDDDINRIERLIEKIEGKNA